MWSLCRHTLITTASVCQPVGWVSERKTLWRWKLRTFATTWQLCKRQSPIWRARGLGSYHYAAMPAIQGQWLVMTFRHWEKFVTRYLRYYHIITTNEDKNDFVSGVAWHLDACGRMSRDPAPFFTTLAKWTAHWDWAGWQHHVWSAQGIRYISKKKRSSKNGISYSILFDQTGTLHPIRLQCDCASWPRQADCTSWGHHYWRSP